MSSARTRRADAGRSKAGQWIRMTTALLLLGGALSDVAAAQTSQPQQATSDAVAYGRETWIRGRGRLSQQGFVAGTGTGSAYSLRYGADRPGLYFLRNGTGPGSEYFWRYGVEVGSAYFWRHGTDAGSEQYWRRGEGCLSQRGWETGATCTALQADLLITFCVAGVMNIELCQAVNDTIDTAYINTPASSDERAWLRRMRTNPD